MNSLTSPQSISSPKEILYNRISDAIKLNDEDLLAFLENLLVHRYGLQSLNDYSDTSHNFVDTNSLSKEESFDIDNVQPKEAKSSLNTILPNDQSEDEELTPFEELGDNSSELCTLKNVNASNDVNDLIPESNLPLKGSEASSQEFVESISLPPSPAISHLRKWIPSFDDEFPKAS